MACICRLEPGGQSSQLVLPYELSVEYYGDVAPSTDDQRTIEIQVIAPTSVYIDPFSPNVETLGVGGAPVEMHTITEHLVLDSGVNSTSVDLRVKYQPAPCNSLSKPSGYTQVQLPSLAGCKIRGPLSPELTCSIPDQLAHAGRTHVSVPTGSLAQAQHVEMTTAITLCASSVLLLLLFTVT